jgi:predicted methyltransferase
MESIKTKNMKRLILLASLVLTSCGPTDEMIRASKQAKEDSLQAAQFSSGSEVIESNNSKPYYNATELSLPTGTVLAFAPDDETIQAKSENGICSEQIYISILHDDGHISIHETTYKIWVNVYTKSILK